MPGTGAMTGAGNLVIAGCSRRKLDTAIPVPALELYQGGCIPTLRARLGPRPRFRQRVRILSARHGLVSADRALLPYDEPLTLERAIALQPAVLAELTSQLGLAGSSTSTEGGSPIELLALLEPLYLVPLAGLLALPGPSRPRIRWVPDPGGAGEAGGWPAAAAILDAWGWP